MLLQEEPGATLSEFGLLLEVEALTAIAPLTKLEQQPAFMGNFGIRAGIWSYQENISLGKKLSFALFQSLE